MVLWPALPEATLFTEFLHFLPWDHMLFRIVVVRFCFSCLGTTRFSGSLWSGFAFLALEPHALPNRCGLVLLFLLWDHTLFQIAVVRFCFSCLGTTCPSGSLWSGLAFLALGPHPALKTVFSQFRFSKTVLCFVAFPPCPHGIQNRFQAFSQIG